MRYVLWIVAAILCGCASSPKLDDSELARVRSSVPLSEGPVKAAAIAIWLPGSEDFRFKAVEPKVQGVAVVTSKTFLFQQWGGQAGLTNAKAIPYSSITNVSLNTFGRSARIRIRSTDGTVDSFAASDGQGEISMRSTTEEMFKVLAESLAPSQTSPP